MVKILKMAESSSSGLTTTIDQLYNMGVRPPFFMSLFRKLATVAVGLSLFGAPSLAKDNHEEHQVLWDSLERKGVEVLLNDTDLCDGEAAGLYSPSHNVLVVCQDRRLPLTTREVEWTPNDYDTLRHEAHHVLQDCLDGLDNDTSVLFFEGRKMKEFVSNSLTQKQIERIIKMYSEAGADDDVIRMELEAFAVAQTVSPLTIADGIDELCRV